MSMEQKSKRLERGAGILLPISSLPSPYGIGSLGKEAYQFVDQLEEAGQKYWQVLPVGPTSFGDSPYQSFSTFAGNPYFIDLDLLQKEGLLEKEEIQKIDWGELVYDVDYQKMYVNRFGILKKAFLRWQEKSSSDYQDFVHKNQEWLEDYSLFMSCKDYFGGVEWLSWSEDIRCRKETALKYYRQLLKEKMEFWCFVQYKFFEQWNALKKYANQKEIQIIGDIPIYVALDSADVWANPGQYQLDETLHPIDVAGCPPDAFSEDGQLWGNPLFRWDVMKKNGYTWWTKRIAAMSKLYDIVRIDHFRGFDSYYAIPAKDKTAKNGEWRKGPGMDLFHTLEQKLGRLNIIVEDLGFLTPSVLKLVADSGFPGMKVIQFAFDSREGSNYLPHTYTEHCVVYTGTHDNDTLLGWMKTAPKESVKFAKEYLNLTKEEGYNWGMMRGAWSSVGELAVVPMQDLIGLGSEARMNTPSTLGGNWQWRATSDQITVKLAKRLYNYMEMYGRLWVGEDADRKEQ